MAGSKIAARVTRVLLRRLGFVLPLLLPLLVLAGWQLGGAWNFLTVVMTFGLLPLADHLIGVDTAVIAADSPPDRRWRRFFDGVLYAWAPIQLALLAFALLAVGDAQWLAALGLTLSVGVAAGGIGIVVAHELGHRLGRTPRIVAGVLLSSVGYLHYHIEHNQGHHSHVGTEGDPTTARAGEGLWSFVPRAVVQSFASAWRIEGRRLAAGGRGVLSPRNRMLWALIIPTTLAVLIWVVLGVPAVALFIGQALTAITLLEAVNYIEHYGLVRGRSSDGRYERVGLEHSWNSSQRLSGWLTFNLPRHSHHHVQVTRPYPELEHAPAAPQLPSGYLAMLPLAMVPPLWRRIIDRRLRDWRMARAEET
jgi:alkane 1-monooxygenase